MTSAPGIDRATGGIDLRMVAVVGLAAGALGGLFGVGGGLIIVPGLIGLAKMNRRLAHGTSLAATLPIAVASFLTYFVNGRVDWPIAAGLAVGAVAGAVLGTGLLQVIPRRPLTLIFVVTILATAIRLFLATDAPGRAEVTAPTLVVLVIVGFATGTLAGLLGIGGGVIMIPVMVVFYGMAPVVAKGTSVAVIIPTALMGTWRNRKHANADITAAAVCGFAGVITATIGAMIADQIGDQLSNVTFGALLVVLALFQLSTLREPDGG